MAITLNDLALQVARRYKAALGGTATAGTTTTLIDTVGLIPPDNVWRNHFVRLVTGTYAGQERLVTGSTQATKAITFDPALAGAVVAGDRYTIMPLQWDRVNDAIQAGIRAAGQKWIQFKRSADIPLTSEQEYALPADCVTVHQVYLGSAGYFYPYTAYEVTGSSGAYKVMLRQGQTLPVTYGQAVSGQSLTFMRVDYTALPALAAGSSTLGLGDYENEASEFVTEYALYVLKQTDFDGDVTGAAARGSLAAAERHLANAEKIKQQARIQQVPGRARTRPLPRFVQ